MASGDRIVAGSMDRTIAQVVHDVTRDKNEVALTFTNSFGGRTTFNFKRSDQDRERLPEAGEKVRLELVIREI